MSSDLLIGLYRHGVVRPFRLFWLGMYGAAAALISVKPPSIWLAIPFGWSRRRNRRLRRLLLDASARHYFAITTLIFSQIFYVIIFTWTR